MRVAGASGNLGPIQISETALSRAARLGRRCCPHHATPQCSAQAKRIGLIALLGLLLACALAASVHATQVGSGSVRGRSLAAKDKASLDEEDEDFGEVADADPGDEDEEVKTGSKTAGEGKKAKAKPEPLAEAKPAAAAPVAAAPVAAPAKTAVKAKKKRDKKPAFINKVIEFAPEANITYGDDIDDFGAGWER